MRFTPLRLLTWPFRVCFSARRIAFVPILALTAGGVICLTLACAAMLACANGPFQWLARVADYLGVLAFYAFVFGVPCFGALMLIGGCWSATGKRNNPGGWMVAILGPLAAVLLWYIGLLLILIAAINTNRILEERHPASFTESIPKGTPTCRVSSTSTSMSSTSTAALPSIKKP